MNVVIVLEIVGGIVLLALAARYAVRDTRQRRGGTEDAIESTDTGEAAPAHADEREVQQHPSEVADQRKEEDQREGEEATALSAASTAPESPADTR